MARWPRGEAEIEQQILQREMQSITGAEADGTPLLKQARRTVETASSLIETDTHSAYVLAYDAARFACIALLAQQGLRSTTTGGHYAVERAVRAQFGDGFRPFADMRRRRHELEYPHLPTDTPSEDEVREAVQAAERLITAASQLIGQLSFFAHPEAPQRPPS
ncbi:MAG TPA: HEPN domain-containing protein [Streptosporangiaceae bacterium]|nr:HEPN domain-containing protein [Streptosporangiaceae bacterium]